MSFHKQRPEGLADAQDQLIDMDEYQGTIALFAIFDIDPQTPLALQLNTFHTFYIFIDSRGRRCHGSPIVYPLFIIYHFYSFVLVTNMGGGFGKHQIIISWESDPYINWCLHTFRRHIFLHFLTRQICAF